MSEEDEILWNEAALNSLKRSQLLSLSRKYGLKGSGKNVDLVARLQEFAKNLDATHMSIDLSNTTAADMTDDPSIATGMEAFEQSETDGEGYQFTSSPLRPLGDDVDGFDDEDTTTPQQTPILSRINHPLFIPPPQPSPRQLPAIPDHLLDQITTTSPSKRPRPSSIASEATAKNWEILDVDTASLASPAKGGEYGSWKSAGNGESLGKKSKMSKATEEFGMVRSESAGSASSRTKMSLKALASSLRKSTSKNVESSSSADYTATEPPKDTPPSPAPTVGIPERHPHASLGANSTIRMVSSTSLPLSPGTPGPEVDNTSGSPDWKSLTPMQSGARYQPPISPSGSQASTMYASTIATGHGRNGSIAGTIMGSQASGFFGHGSIQSPGLVMGSASLSQVYPPLPMLPSQYVKPTSPPGSFPQSTPFVFGSPLPQNGISNEEFSSAGLKVLEEMNARLGDRGTLGRELLKGKAVDLKGVVKTNDSLDGTNGFGLSKGKEDRFAEAHEREFAKMASISTHAAARRGMSVPPRPATSAHSSLTSRSTATLPLSTSTPTRPKRKLATAATTPSAPNGLPLAPADDPSQGRYKRSRLSIGSSKALGSIREAGVSVARLTGLAPEARKEGDTSELMKRLREKREKRRSMAGLAAKARRLSGRLGLTRKKADAPPVPERKKFDLQASLRKGSTSVRDLVRRGSTSSTDLLTVSTKASSKVSTAPSAYRALQTPSLAKSSTAPSVVSSKSLTPVRPKIPAFDKTAMGPPPVPKLIQSQITKASTITSPTSLPPPPRPSGPRQNSSLHAPTASSLARMQATVKPRVNKTSTTPSEASTVLSPATKTNQATPAKSALRPKNPPSGTPIQSARAAARARGSGLTAVKSRGNLKAELEMQARRNEIKARRERITEQRRLEEMLGQGQAL